MGVLQRRTALTVAAIVFFGQVGVPSRAGVLGSVVPPRGGELIGAASRILLILQNAGAQTRIKDSLIGIQYVGPSDKPVTPVVIARSRNDADLFKKTILKLSDLDMTDVHMISSSLMEKLVSAAQENQRGRAEDRALRATAVVLLTIITSGHRTEIHFDHRDAIETLERLGKISKGSPALKADITHFQTRI
jgi:hypothetical protein